MKVLGSTQKRLLANGAMEKLVGPVLDSVDYRMVTETSRSNDYRRELGLEEPSDRRAS